MFNIKTTLLIKIGITVHSSRRFSVRIKNSIFFAIFPRNTEIPVFLGLSESCVYLVSFYVAVFPNLAVIYHQYTNYMPF